MATKIINPIEYAKLYGTHKSLIHRWLKNKKKLPLVEKVTRERGKYFLEVPNDLSSDDLACFRRFFKKDRVKKKVSGDYFDWEEYNGLIL